MDTMLRGIYQAPWVTPNIIHKILLSPKGFLLIQLTLNGYVEHHSTLGGWKVTHPETPGFNVLRAPMVMNFRRAKVGNIYEIILT